MGACSDVVVRPADVGSLTIDPPEAQVVVGSSVALTARPLDEQGRPLSGLSVSWASRNSAVATVDADGVVTGRSRGEAEIEATAGASTATATVMVMRAPAVVLGQTTLGFSGQVGASDPPPDRVSISNGGDLPLTGLAASVDFGAGPAGWLSVRVEGDAAPAELVVAVTMSGLEPGTHEATVSVTAESAPGPPAELPVTLEIRTGSPDAPTDPTAVVLTPSSIRVSWSDNTSSETGFRIERREGTGPFEQVAAVGPDVTSWDDTGVQRDRVYGYRVRACGSAGCSAFSGIASTTTPPVAPTALQAASVSTTSIQLSWSDESRTEAQFEIERRSGGDSFTRTATPPAGSTTHTDQNLATATSYTYRIRACNGGGCSPWSEEATASTSAIPVPAAPSGLTATAVEAGPRINLAWTDQSGSETELEVERKAAGGAYAPVATLEANVTSYADLEVRADTTYTYRVRACGDGGCSVYSNEASATTRPVAPTDVAATATSSTTVRVSWTDASATEASFRIEWKTGSGSYAEAGTAPADSTTFVHAGRQPATTYTYRLQACNAGGCSAYSAGAPATTPSLTVPAAPGGLTAVATENEAQIRLAWSDESADETGFRVQRRAPGESQFSVRATLEAGVEAYTDDDVDPDGTYVYRVEAYAAGGAAPSNEASATTFPTAPTGLEATAVSSSRIDLEWTDGSATESQFRIERRTGGGGFDPIGTAGAGATSYSDAPLDAEQTYTYRVQACNAGGCSAYTNEASATTSATPPPATPTNLVAELGSGSIGLEWVDNATDEDRYRVQRSVDGGAFSTLPTTLAANATSYVDTDVGPDTDYTYRVEACRGTTLCSDYSNEASATTLPVPPSALAATATSASTIEVAWTDDVKTETSFQLQRKPAGGTYETVATPPAGTESHSSDGLEHETTYTYRIRSCNVTGCSAYGAEASATTYPPPPSGLAVSTVSSTELSLSWVDESDTETLFGIERRTGMTGAFTQIETVPQNAISFQDTGLQPGTLYEYQVRACRNEACSVYSNKATGTTDGVPGVPSGVSATATSTSTVELSWTDNSTTEQEFRIDRRVGAGSWIQLEVVGADTTAFADTGLSPETTYGYRLRACSGASCSDYSAEATVVTWLPAPTGLVATTGTADTVSLTWTDNSATETGFEIEQASGGGWTPVNTTSAGVEAYEVSGLQPGTTYTFRVRAIGASSSSAWSDEDDATTAPPAPSSFTATGASDTSIQLSWAEDASAETGFEIERRTGGAAFAPLTTEAAGSTSHLDTGLDPATTYDYRIRTCRDAACSAWATTSGATQATSAPAAPTGLTASYSTGTVQLTWADVATETGYSVLRSTNGASPVEIASLDANADSHHDATLMDDTEYTYRVAACNDGGCTESGPVSVTTPPAAPSGFGASATSSTSILLTWTDASETETRFEIERRPEGGSFAPLATVPANETEHEDTDSLLAGVTYEYRIQACNDTGCSAAVTASTTTPVLP